MLRAACLLASLSIVSGCSSSADSFRAQVKTVAISSGERVAYYERGQGRPLLMLTGTGSTMSEWDPALISLLARDRRLILLDYPGVGLSSSYQGRLSFARMADQVNGFLDARGLTGVDVLGWSMGGFVAQQLAVRHPQRVRRLILAGTNPGGSRAVLGSEEDQRSDSDPDRSDREVLKELYPRTRRGQAEGRAFLRRLEKASQEGVIPDDFRVPERTQRDQVKAEDPWLSSNANWDALRRLEMPVLAAAGRLDRATPPVNMRRIARRAGGQYAEFPGSHAFLFSDRRAFSARVSRFLSD